MKAKIKSRQAGFTLIEYIVGLVVAAIIAAMVYSFFGTALTQSGEPLLRLQKASNLSKVMENITADYHQFNAINLRYHWQPSTYYSLDSIVTPITIPASPQNGHYYKCVAAGTSGTAPPANWPTGSGATVTDGGVTWKESGNLIWQKSHAYSVGDIVVPVYNNGHFYRCTTAGTSGEKEPQYPSNPWRTGSGEPVDDGGVTWTEAGTVLESDYAADLKDNLSTPSLYGTGYTITENKFIQFSGTAEVDAGSGGTSSEKNNLKVTIKSTDSAETLSAIFTIR